MRKSNFLKNAIEEYAPFKTSFVMPTVPPFFANVNEFQRSNAKSTSPKLPIKARKKNIHIKILDELHSVNKIINKN